MLSASVQEIFASVQGEGPWVGQRHIFVRFRGCDMACRYCDTPDSQSRDIGHAGACRVQKNPSSFSYDEAACNLSGQEVTKFCERLRVPGPGKPVLCLTGGEPLLQPAFLSKWLPEMKVTHSVYLETNGIHYREMAGLRNMIDIVSMDFKLPSATGQRPFWQEHEKFMAEARGTLLFVKAVVTADTAEEDIVKSSDLIAGYDRSVPFIIQPAGGQYAPDPGLIIRLQNRALGILEDVRVIPQAHKTLKLA